jgi:hypothetical protein
MILNEQGIPCPKIRDEEGYGAVLKQEGNSRQIKDSDEIYKVSARYRPQKKEGGREWTASRKSRAICRSLGMDAMT